MCLNDVPYYHFFCSLQTLFGRCTEFKRLDFLSNSNSKKSFKKQEEY